MKKFSLNQAQYSVGSQREWLYNAIDTVATFQVRDAISLPASEQRAHDFYMAVQGPAFDMTIRGIAVDELERQELIRNLGKELRKTEAALAKDPKITAVWDKLEKETGACKKSTRKDGKHTWTKGVPDGIDRLCVSCGKSRMKVRPFKASSDDDKMHLFYDILKMKPQLNKEHKFTADKEARGRLKKAYPKHEELITQIDTIADLAKQIQFLSFKGTGRFYASFNVGVTATHRWSSNMDPFKRGKNAQNITEKHRHIFIPDPGMELCYADLKQAESNTIAHIAGDENYIEAHRLGDTHTFVCRLVWPEGVCGQAWTGDIFADKKIATSCAPEWDNKPGHDYRYQSKAVQHGSNLGLTPFGIAIKRQIPQAAALESQKRYFNAFAGIRGWQHRVKETVEAQEPIVTPLGIRFKLLGRPWDDHTVREGLAKEPQSVVGHVTSIGCWRIWVELPVVQLLAQVHDAILFQFPKGRYDLVYQALELMRVPIQVTGLDGKIRTMVIGTEAAVGMNWGHHSAKNPNGIREITFKSPTEWSIK